jgi:hypothetical protein
MRFAKGLFQIRTACLPARHEGGNSVPVAVLYHLPRHQGRSLICRSRFSTTCADPPAQHGLRAQARLSTNDPGRIPARYRLR